MKKIIITLLLSVCILAGCTQKKNQIVREVPHLEPSASPLSEQPAEPSPSVTPAPTPAPTVTPKPRMLGSAETKILDFHENRINNIRLCAEKINGYKLGSGESFSFNQVVGARTPERGYQKATVLIQQEKVQDYGGGVCQVSTTLFQAARAAGLMVTERHNHQKDVGYAHPGDDAAVDYGNKDMSFINNTNSTIEIAVTVGNGKVRAEIREAR